VSIVEFLVLAAAAVIVIARFELLCLRELAGTSEVELRFLTRAGWTALITSPYRSAESRICTSDEPAESNDDRDSLSDSRSRCGAWRRPGRLTVAICEPIPAQRTVHGCPAHGCLFDYLE